MLEFQLQAIATEVAATKQQRITATPLFNKTINIKVKRIAR
jgi:hypothetical protein